MPGSREHGDDGLALLQEMHREWPFFASVLSNMEMVLSKADLAIASRYAGLVADETLRTTIFGRIRTELESTVAALLRIMGTDSLLADNPQLARSIKYRFPVPRSAEPHPGGTAAAVPRGRPRRAQPSRHPPDDQRHRGRLAQQRLTCATGPRIGSWS